MTQKNDGYKLCSGACGLVKPLMDFYTKKNGTLKSWCKCCCNEYNKGYYKKNKEKAATKGKEYREKNREKINKRERDRYRRKNNIEILPEGFKKCNGICGKILPIENFPFKSKKNGTRKGKCKECEKQHKMEYNEKYHKDNKEAIKKQQKEYRENNKEKISQKRKREYQNNKQSILIRSKKYYWKNREMILERNKQYRNNNKNKISQQRKERKSKINEYEKNKRNNDLNYKIASNLRRRLRNIIKSQKAGSAVQDLGCTVEELKASLESQFYSHPRTGEKMTWDNYGKGWHIDHTLPLSFFNLTKREEFLVACGLV